MTRRIKYAGISTAFAHYQRIVATSHQRRYLYGIINIMKRIITSGLVASVVLFLLSYGGLYLAIQLFPQVFVEYNNPLFNSDGSRDVLFYSHAIIISFALAVFWERFKGVSNRHFIIRGMEFGLLYALVALLPVMWITFSSLDITFVMVATWFLYGLFQALIAGVIFAKINP